MTAVRAVVARLAPFLACLGLLAVWQCASLALNNDSFPTALEAIRAIPSILGDKEASKRADALLDGAVLCD